MYNAQTMPKGRRLSNPIVNFRMPKKDIPFQLPGEVVDRGYLTVAAWSTPNR